MKHMGKYLVIEGTDCSGKETQSKLLMERFEKEGISMWYRSFPNYESPTGKIIWWPYLGKTSIGEWFFPEWATKVNPQVASLYFAADRLYNLPEIEKRRKSQNLILDRYVYSNMAHQWGKIVDEKQRKQLYQWIEELEFNFLWLPQAEIKIFLHMPLSWTLELQKQRNELDQHEKDFQYLKNAEIAYLEIAEIYHFTIIECIDAQGKIKSIESIHEELYQKVKELL